MLRLPINDQGWGLFTRLIVNFRRSRQGNKATSLFLAIVILMLGLNGLNIMNSYIGRDFMSALADRDAPRFMEKAFLWATVFMSLTGVAVVLRYCEERLGLVWREFMTGQFVSLYISPGTYYRMNDEIIRQSGVEHPDQRIADDVKTFTTVTLSFILMVMNGLFTIIAFSGVLWMISPWLFGAAILYAILGSLITVLVGGRLVELNYAQLDKEATFRAGLIHVRERAESIALLHHESRLRPRLMRQFKALADNFRAIINVNRNLGFFTTGYNYMIQIIPILLVAPLFMQGRVEFGVVTQSAMAFQMLVGAFSLVVTQFQSLSSFAAVIQRLISLWYVIELAQASNVSGLNFKEGRNEIMYQDLTLFSPNDKRVLIKGLSGTIKAGQRVLVSGDEPSRDALFRATAGIYDAGSGTVTRPPLERILFLPERPYLPPGTLRQCLAPPGRTRDLPDDEILDLFAMLGIEDVPARSGGLDVEQDWDGILSAPEQRIISFARILIAKPRFVIMANPYRDMDEAIRTRVFRLLKDQRVTLVNMGQLGQDPREDPLEEYDVIIELGDGGRWEWRQGASEA